MGLLRVVQSGNEKTTTKLLDKDTQCHFYTGTGFITNAGSGSAF